MVCKCAPAAVVSFQTAHKIYQCPLYALVVAKMTCANWRVFCSSITRDKNTQHTFFAISLARRSTCSRMFFSQMHILLWRSLHQGNLQTRKGHDAPRSNSQCKSCWTLELLQLGLLMWACIYHFENILKNEENTVTEQMPTSVLVPAWRLVFFLEATEWYHSTRSTMCRGCLLPRHIAEMVSLERVTSAVGYLPDSVVCRPWGVSMRRWFWPLHQTNKRRAWCLEIWLRRCTCFTILVTSGL